MVYLLLHNPGVLNTWIGEADEEFGSGFIIGEVDALA
jgi:hypothetical protein